MGSLTSPRRDLGRNKGGFGVHFPYGRKVKLVIRDRNGPQGQLFGLGGGAGDSIRRPADGDQGEGHLPLGVQTEEFVYIVVGKSGNHPGGHIVGRCHRQRVGQNGAAVPEGVAVLAGLVLAGVAPGDVREDDYRRRGGYPRLAGAGFDQSATVVVGP